MNSVASLPMYNFAELRPANLALWAAIVDLLQADGCRNLPDTLEPDERPLPDTIENNVLLTQMCGYPLRTIYQGQYQVLAAPTYDVAGCGRSTHRAFVVVRDDAPFDTIESLRGRRFAINSSLSNTGMNLPRLLFAPLARSGRFLGETVHTGAHARSIDHVRTGVVDAASIDCVTWAYVLEHRPDTARGVRILAETAPSPTIPFVTSSATPPALVERLRRALVTIGTSAAFEDIRAGLRLASIDNATTEPYDSILGFERDAVALGYGRIV